jgi:hypothetical protein
MSFRFITKSIHAYLIDYPRDRLDRSAVRAEVGQSGSVACGFRLLSASRRYSWRP